MVSGLPFSQIFFLKDGAVLGMHYGAQSVLQSVVDQDYTDIVTVTAPPWGPFFNKR